MAIMRTDTTIRRWDQLQGRSVCVAPAQDRKTISLLRRVAAEWAAEDYPDALVKNAVRNMAFEVYLEQDVPDCH